MLRINKIGIGSAFRVSALLSIVWWILLMAFLLLITAVAGNSSSGYYSSYDSGYQYDLGGEGILIMLCGVPIYAIIGGIAGALSAFIYNIVAGLVGGLEIEVERITTQVRPVTIPKAKRDDWDAPEY